MACPAPCSRAGFAATGLRFRWRRVAGSARPGQVLRVPVVISAGRARYPHVGFELAAHAATYMSSGSEDSAAARAADCAARGPIEPTRSRAARRGADLGVHLVCPGADGRRVLALVLIPGGPPPFPFGPGVRVILQQPLIEPVIGDAAAVQPGAVHSPRGSWESWIRCSTPGSRTAAGCPKSSTCAARRKITPDHAGQRGGNRSRLAGCS